MNNELHKNGRGDDLPLPEPDSFVHCDTGTIKVDVPVFVGETMRAYGQAYAAAAVARERERIVDIVLIELDCNGQAGWPAYNGERMCK